MLRPNGNEAPQATVFASGLNYPFGIAFYPPGNDPQWVYVGNTDSAASRELYAWAFRERFRG